MEELLNLLTKQVSRCFWVFLRDNSAILGYRQGEITFSCARISLSPLTSKPPLGSIIPLTAAGMHQWSLQEILHHRIQLPE